MRLARDSIAPFARDAGFLRIGSDIDEADVVLRRSDGQVFVMEKGPGLDGLDDPYMSVWHYILEVDAHGPE